MEDLDQSLWLMKELAIANRVVEIHLHRIAGGKDCMDWREKTFRNSPLRITIHLLANDLPLQATGPNQQAQPDGLDSTLPAYIGTEQVETQVDARINSWESHGVKGAEEESFDEFSMEGLPRDGNTDRCLNRCLLKSSEVIEPTRSRTLSPLPSPPSEAIQAREHIEFLPDDPVESEDLARVAEGPPKGMSFSAS